MTRYLLDTNTLSHLIRQQPAVCQRLQSVPMAALCISAITEGELRFGLARRPEATRLHAAVAELLKRLDVLPWDGSAARHYGNLRAALEQQGKTVAPLDLLIASHAAAVGAVLVSNDQVFGQVTGLVWEDWTR